MTSAGSYGADANSGGNFSANPQYDASGNVKGTVTLLYQRTENGSVHSYRINSASLASMNIVRTMAGGISWVTGPAALTDLTTAGSPIVIDSDAVLFVSLVDNGPAPAIDTLAITVLAKNGGLLFSSKWNGSRTLDQATDSGDILVRKTN